MGLGIETGLLANFIKHDEEGAEYFKEQLTVLNQCLKKAGLPEHQEPTHIQTPVRRDVLQGFPYSFLHYLRRAYAHRLADPTWQATPFDENEDPTQDPEVKEESYMLRSHLLCHSDCEGYYVPIDFEEVILDESQKLAGGLFGSSCRLKEELILVAPALGIQLHNGHLNESEFKRVKNLSGLDQGLHRELCTWLALFEACHESMTNQTLICFT